RLQRKCPAWAPLVTRPELRRLPCFTRGRVAGTLHVLGPARGACRLRSQPLLAERPGYLVAPNTPTQRGPEPIRSKAAVVLVRHKPPSRCFPAKIPCTHARRESSPEAVPPRTHRDNVLRYSFSHRTLWRKHPCRDGLAF